MPDFINNTRIGGVAFLVLSGLFWYFAGDIPLDFWSQQEPFNARSMPRIIAVAGGIASLLLIVAPSEATDWSKLKELDYGPALLLLGLMSLYGLAMEPLGFGLSTLMFLIAAFFVLGERRWRRMILVALPLVAGFWLVMDALDIYLAPGAITRSLLELSGLA